MRISEYIKQLQVLQAINGDVRVIGNNYGSQVFGACREANAPQAAYIAIMSKRESVLRLWNQCCDTDANRGELVVSIR